MVHRLRKSLYGTKQAGRNWYHTAKAAVINCGFVETEADPCMFWHPEKKAALALYVDDLLLGGGTAEWRTSVRLSLNENFPTKLVPEGERTLGLEVHRKDGTYKLTQTVFIDELVEKYGLAEAAPVKTPMTVSDDKRAVHPEDKMMEKPKEYQAAVGALMYLATQTRPDIAYATGKLARVMIMPTERHWKMAMRIIKYLGSTRTLGPTYAPGGDDELVGYCDADYAGCANTRRSTSGMCFMRAGAFVSARSNIQKSTAASTCEAEYMSLLGGTKQALWWRRALIDLEEEVTVPTVLFEDNQGALAMTKDKLVNERSKHIQVAYHFTQEQVEQKTIRVEYKPTDEMLADLMTKALPEERHVRLTRMIMGLK
jgi:hypothetical protein